MTKHYTKSKKWRKKWGRMGCETPEALVQQGSRNNTSFPRNQEFEAVHVGGFSKAQKSDIEKGDINMSRKKKGSVPVAPPKPQGTSSASQEKKMVIDMNTMNLKKEHAVPGFRTGKHMTEKDRPRKKDWKREYERGKEPGRYHDDIGSGSFFSKANRRTESKLLRSDVV